MVSWWLTRCFNPLPTRRSEDAWVRFPVCVVIFGFQSTSDPKVGRCTCDQPSTDHGLGVSIHFRPEGRKMQMSGGAALAPRGVSIHFRPEGRKMPREVMSQSERSTVSTHFRPEGRKMPVLAWGNCVYVTVSIHFRPEGRKMQHCCNSIISLLFLDY